MISDTNQSQDIFENANHKVENQSCDSSTSLPDSAASYPHSAQGPTNSIAKLDARPAVLSPIEEAITEVTTTICEHENDTTVEANGSVLVTSTPQNDESTKSSLGDILAIEVPLSNTKEIVVEMHESQHKGILFKTKKYKIKVFGFLDC